MTRVLHVHRERVRFRDLDGMGHVNNAVFFTYMEQARSEFLLESGLVGNLGQLAIILARTEIDFRAPVDYGESVDVEVRAGRLGTKSFELEYTLRVGDRVVAEGKSVQVGFDYESNETVPIRDEWRKVLTR